MLRKKTNGVASGVRLSAALTGLTGSAVIRRASDPSPVVVGPSYTRITAGHGNWLAVQANKGLGD